MKGWNRQGWFWVTLWTLAGCNRPPGFVQAYEGSSGASFTAIQQQILIPKCLNCHSQQRPDADVIFSTYEDTMLSPGAVTPYQPAQSQIFQQCYDGKMPRQAPSLSDAELQSIYDWIAIGAPNN